jgi:hypothetical protein
MATLGGTMRPAMRERMDVERNGRTIRTDGGCV